MSTSALPTLRQALRQLPHAVGTAGPQLQGSERTGDPSPSTWDLPSSVSTAGPQPGTFRAQWAPLDLNLGPAELSEHRWTSTWDLLSSVSTAGPQRPDRMPEDMPDRTPDSMSDRMPEDMPDKMPEDMPDRMPEDMPDRMPEGMPDRMSDRMPEGMPDKVPECLPDRIPEDLPDRMPDRMSEDMPEDMPDRVPEDMPEDMPGRMPEDMPDRMPDRMPEDMSGRMPEDLPVTKRINVMMGMTRSKVIYRILSYFDCECDSITIPMQYIAVRVKANPTFQHFDIWWCSYENPGILSALTCRAALRRETLRKIFNRIDRDGSGTITVSEVWYWLLYTVTSFVVTHGRFIR